jgi:hypothetical protein
MLFQHRYHAGIRDGSITLTFRAWKTARASRGKCYRLGPEDTIEIRSVDLAALGSITPAEVRRSGFATLDELLAALRKSSDRKLTSRSRVYRVSFRHVRAVDPRAARRADASPDALTEVGKRLERMDKLSSHGPWTLQALRLIDKQPRIAASKLAPRLGRERLAFKADIRKLKGLGLTVSHEVGYSLSKRGKALLARARPGR